jgi:prepilin-type N-terminal cleavage/methylation domain-containing protein/prepilin-type processing-associated H-X9-DG protein
MKTARHPRAFTLIELLVVIAIIAILAAILFPVFAQAKESAKKTVCLTQVKEVGIATLLYLNDYDDTYPLDSYFTFTSTAYTAYFWWGGFQYGIPGFTGPTYSSSYGLLYPYMKNQPIYGCPSSQGLLTELNPGETYLYPLGYGTNLNLMVNENFSGPTVAVNASSVSSAAETVLVADCGGIYTQPGGTFEISQGSTLGYNVFQANYVDGPNKGYGSPYNNPDTWGVHGGGIANVGWADGHAKGMHPTIRPLASEYASGAYDNPPLALEVAQYYKIGDIMNPQYPYGSQYQDYYYQTAKP